MVTHTIYPNSLPPSLSQAIACFQNTFIQLVKKLISNSQGRSPISKPKHKNKTNKLFKTFHLETIYIWEAKPTPVILKAKSET
jgi:hypothetical protein